MVGTPVFVRQPVFSGFTRITGGNGDARPAADTLGYSATHGPYPAWINFSGKVELDHFRHMSPRWTKLIHA
ncbi:hypothetical protein [Nakamurella panacisegetis]|uniref:hypothetical protein n=1 Tax=Nakamurella panacisegetis TaxID=1090615 RepID=UPI000B863DB9|nr:hypothetical protein [Nakamurella panacisegetis]